MKFYVIFAFIVLSVSAMPEKRQCNPFQICTLEYFPICGSDGVTYGNQCMFEAAVACNPGLTLAHYGEC